MGPTLLLES
ncbi:unnamed protein product [Cuscuta europaea]|uniref:Uncharacterized protein n=1 Tax=Cuscuta europaea TaxID=41803 RepID=A0A9P0YRM8_CUSEU|nr:unnamed protein product [Cuscuta europaea]